MEHINKLNSFEDISKIELMNFLKTIKNNIVETFPFLTKEERDEFIIKFNQLEEKEDSSSSQVNLINNIKEVLLTLKNSHTGFRETSNNLNTLEGSKNFVESKLLENNIGYLKVKSWSTVSDADFTNKSKLLEEKINTIKDSDSIIIDVRGNDGGNSNLSQVIASYFINKNTNYCKILRRIQGNNRLSEENLEIKPREVFWDKRLVILTDEKCFSSNEMFILMLKDTGRAITIGQKTGGGSGNPKFFNIKLGSKYYSLRVSTWRMFRNNQQPIEGVGIEPDIEVLKEKNNYKDNELEKAIEYLIKS